MSLHPSKLSMALRTGFAFSYAHLFVWHTSCPKSELLFLTLPGLPSVDRDNTNPTLCDSIGKPLVPRSRKMLQREINFLLDLLGFQVVGANCSLPDSLVQTGQIRQAQCGVSRLVQLLK